MHFGILHCLTLPIRNAAFYVYFIVSLFVWKSIYQFIHQFLFLSLYLLVCLSVYLSFDWPIDPYVCLSISLYFFVSLSNTWPLAFPPSGSHLTPKAAYIFKPKVPIGKTAIGRFNLEVVPLIQVVLILVSFF